MWNLFSIRDNNKSFNKTRAPRTFEEISIYFLIIICICLIISFLQLKSIFKQNQSWLETTKLYNFCKIYIIDKITNFIKESYLIVYVNSLQNNNIPIKFYLICGNLYFKFWCFCKQKTEIPLFMFYYFPQLILAITFFIEITIKNELNFFYKLFPFFFISIFFNVLFLYTVYDFSVQTFNFLQQYIDHEFENNEMKIFVDQEALKNNIFTDLNKLIKIYRECVYNLIPLTEIKNLKIEYDPIVKSIIAIFYLNGWLSLFIYYFFHFWLFFKFSSVLNDLVLFFNILIYLILNLINQPLDIYII